MGNNYNQLNIEDRVMIGMLKSEGKSLRTTASELGRSLSTISRELKRNSSLVEVGKYLYKLDSGFMVTGSTTTTAVSFTPSKALSVGSHTLYVQEKNASDIWSPSGRLTITITSTSGGGDTTVPTITLKSPASGAIGIAFKIM